jgi:hypothetical protein
LPLQCTHVQHNTARTRASGIVHWLAWLPTYLPAAYIHTSTHLAIRSYQVIVNITLADVGDGKYDSAVFLQQYSFSVTIW